MKLNFADTDIRINISFAAIITLMLVIDESGICALALFCCIFHEAGHILCLWAMGEKPGRIVFSFYGIKLERLPMAFHGKINEIIVFASGPFANFVLSLFLILVSAANETLKIWALISLITGVFNLIPIRPLDGGNILFTLLCRLIKEEKAGIICDAVSAAVTVPLLFAGIALASKARNYSLLASAVYLVGAGISEKKRIRV